MVKIASPDQTVALATIETDRLVQRSLLVFSKDVLRRERILVDLSSVARVDGDVFVGPKKEIPIRVEK